MSTQNGISRREALARGAALLAATAAIGAGCEKKPAVLACTDVTGLQQQEVQMRNILGYIDRSDQPDKTCGNCLQYTAGAPAQCGSCRIVKGPINPGGYCKSWVKKQA